MRKLIEKQDLGTIVCDNPECNVEFNLEDSPSATIVDFIDMPCPECGQNLLTRQDYDIWRHVNAYVNFKNKWFSWITIFMSKERYEKSQKTIKVHVHKGIKVE